MPAPVHGISRYFVTAYRFAARTFASSKTTPIKPHSDQSLQTRRESFRIFGGGGAAVALLALRCEPFNTEMMHWQKAEELYRFEYFADALEEYKICVDLFRATDPDIAEKSQFQIARICDENLSRFEDAVEAYRDYREFPVTTPEHLEASLIRLAQIYDSDLGKYDLAVVRYRQYIAEYPDSEAIPDFSFRIARIYDEKMGDYTKAVEEYASYASSYPHRENAEMALKRAADISEFELHDHGYAISLYKKFIDKYPGSADAEGVKYRIAEIYDQKIGDYSNAITAYRLFTFGFPKSKLSPAAQLRIADILYEKFNDPNSAFFDYYKVINNYPETEQAKDAYVKIAEIFTEQKKYPAAIGAYKAIADKYFGTAAGIMAQTQIAVIYYEYLADYNKAADACKKVLDDYIGHIGAEPFKYYYNYAKSLLQTICVTQGIGC